jgi:serine/threonine-protein kinase SRPK3
MFSDSTILRIKNQKQKQKPQQFTSYPKSSTKPPKNEPPKPDSYSDEEESPGDYRHGGYHPVKIGDLFNDGQYQVISKLGWGHFSTVWLAIDTHKTSGDLNYRVALKIVKSDGHYTNAALDEIRLLQTISREKDKLPATDCDDHFPVVILLNNFWVKGPHGSHVCMVFEVLGDNLLTLIRRNDHRGLELDLVKQITRQILQGLDFLHANCQIIHTDLKPENILLTAESTEYYKNTVVNNTPLSTSMESLTIGDSKVKKPPLRVKIADLGNACWVDRHFTEAIQTRQYRSPEVLIGAQYSTPADIWSVACLVFELVTGDFLFSPKSSHSFSKDEDHLAQILELVDPDPAGRDYLMRAGQDSHRFFTRHGRLISIPNLDYWHLDLVFKEKYHLPHQESGALTSLLLPILQVDPAKRCTAAQALSHTFLS